MSDSMPVNEQMIQEIKASIVECSERALFASSKWSAELYQSIPLRKRRPLTPDSPNFFSTSTPARPRFEQTSFAAQTPLLTQTPDPSSHLSQPLLFALSCQNENEYALLRYTASEDAKARQNELEELEQDALTAARACFQSREYARVPVLLDSCESAKAQFLSLYSKFLILDRDAQKQWRQLESRRTRLLLSDDSGLTALLSDVPDETDPWFCYLRGCMLQRLSRRAEAVECAILSIAGFPWNSAAWQLLRSCIDDANELNSLVHLLPLPESHPLSQLLQVETLNELNIPTDHELFVCDQLLKDDFFPKSLYIMTLRGCVLHHLHDFPRARSQFERILAIDPDQVDGMDIYSNVLFVEGSRLKLSTLARHFIRLEKDRPETCCIVGNYLALRGERMAAIQFFMRATELDRTYTSAWTLMGHEYVEMKNAHAAIAAYRRAIAVNRKDHRAWHGIGQAYELLNMVQYSLYYYQYATALKPYDFRIWQAQAESYEHLGLIRETIECLKRALISADPDETSISLKLANLHYEIGEDTESEVYHRRVIDLCRSRDLPVSHYSRSCIAVAEYHMQNPDGNLALARDCLQIVARSNSDDVFRASDLLKKLDRMIDGH